MEFCDECGSMMKTKTINGEAVWECPNGHQSPKDPEANYVVTSEQEVTEIIESEGGNTALPTTEERCPNCGNDRAYWYMQQIRSADESETRFFVCIECDHRWREDDH